MNKSNFLTFLLIPTIIGIEINSETIHFTNSPQHLLTTKNFTTYKLNVQGSEPITIIESNSYNPRENQGITSRTLNIDRNDNVVKSTLGLRIIEADNSNEESVDGDETIVSQKKTVYSPILLKKFLKDYSDRINGASSTMKNKLNDLAHIKYSADDEDLSSEDKHGSDFELRKNYHPYNDRDGWVTLEPIPWSSSKVSKWQPNKKPYKATPWNEYEDKSQEYPMRPKPPQYYDSVEMDDFYENRPSSTYKPSVYPRPWNTNNYDDENERPNNYNSRPSVNNYNFNNQKPHYDSFYDNYKPQSNDKPWNDDIISDNRPSDFPDFPQENKPIYEKPYFYEQNHNQQHFNTNRRPSLDSYSSGSSSSHSSVPGSYPSNGNGEWVLISTTKGYHNNKRHGKRAVVYNATNHQGLTVIPDKNNFNKISSPYSGVIEIASPDKNLNKLSTAYGGLIEVAPSVETLESISDKNKIKNAITKKKANIKKLQMSRNSQDSTAMFAAVGAGMVPALVAMAMPMVLGKRKKRDLFNITKTPNDYEDSIPRNYRL